MLGDIRGRGGTVLQPGIRALERAKDVPDDAPILVITEGFCDPLAVGRLHAFLMPEGARLRFPSRAPRFAFECDAEPLSEAPPARPPPGGRR